MQFPSMLAVLHISSKRRFIPRTNDVYLPLAPPAMCLLSQPLIEKNLLRSSGYIKKRKKEQKGVFATTGPNEPKMILTTTQTEEEIDDPRETEVLKRK